MTTQAGLARAEFFSFWAICVGHFIVRVCGVMEVHNFWGIHSFILYLQEAKTPWVAVVWAEGLGYCYIL